MAVELSSRGIACGVARVARLLKTLGFEAIQPKSYQPRTTESRHRLGYNQNLLAGRAAPTNINEVWVGDITYIPLSTRTSCGRFGYLALLMDLCSRRIVGWEYASAMDEDLVLGALRRAIGERQPPPALIHHTDLELVEYANGPEALRELSGYICYYNAERRHSSLGYVSPAQFETNLAVRK